MVSKVKLQKSQAKSEVINSFGYDTLKKVWSYYLIRLPQELGESC